MMTMTIRPARAADRDALINVEAGATPNLSYVGHVFDQFLADERGEFSVVEVEGSVVACGKFTVVPDGSAWLETIRVLPAYQGRGIGKRFYERFFDLAHEQNIDTMRMYTGTQNAVSKGLAEHFGFALAQTFGGASLSLPAQSKNVQIEKSAPAFRPVTDPAEATHLLLAQADEWGGYLVLNRTFYRLTPELCAALVDAGQIYVIADSGADTASAGESVVVVGARFMPQSALHVGHFHGDAASCLKLAARIGSKTKSDGLSCLFPIASTKIIQSLQENGFQPNPAKFIVMARHL